MDNFSLFIGFLTGIIVHRVLSSIWDLGQIGLYIREVEKNALVMLASVAESIAYIQTVKYNTMKEAEVPEDTIRATKNIDDYNYEAWKNSAVSNLLASYPPKYRSFAKYVDWSSAMKFLDKIYKKGHRES
mgnify:CR=1 FL=1|tara:strand:- start:813 stop:1202 length:390 start_codon:yes stop_codon:yes gene_type:complete